MVSATQDDLLYLSSKFSKTLKSRFGKGPETCHVILIENKLFIHINNFMTPAEEVLVHSNQPSLAYQFRTAVIDVICKDFIVEVSSVFGVPFHSSYHDWSFEYNRGILIIETNHIIRNEAYIIPIQPALFSLLKSIYAKEYKAPEKFRVIKWNQNVCIVECQGIMHSIDRFLYNNGHRDILVAHTQEMKRSFKNNQHQFEELFDQSIEVFFVIYDYEHNKKFIVIQF
jgi:uncharacterized protein YbcI